MKYILLFVFIALAGLPSTVTSGYSDTSGYWGVALAKADEAANSPTSSSSSEKLTSDAQFDKRLPPVLPGEEISDGKKTMKVWSTTGGVPVSAAPEPFSPCSAENQAGCNKVPNEVGVIVDQRRNTR